MRKWKMEQETKEKKIMEEENEEEEEEEEESLFRLILFRERDLKSNRLSRVAFPFLRCFWIDSYSKLMEKVRRWNHVQKGRGRGREIKTSTGTGTRMGTRAGSGDEESIKDSERKGRVC